MTNVPEHANSTALVQLFATVAMTLAFALCVALVAKDMDSPNFWYDEAGQYWLAVGQGHYSAAGTPNGTLYDVWVHSLGGNSDPGGFTLLVRMISEWVGSTPTALRIAPMTFSLGALLLVIYWGHLLRLPIALAIAASLVLLNNPDLLLLMLELRAYSMEFCGVIALFLATVLLIKSPRVPFLAIWIAIFAVFSLSRYPFLVYAGSACALVLSGAVRQRRKDSRALYFAIGAALVIYLAIYFGMLRFQSILNGHPFIGAYTFKGKTWAEIGAILSQNFLLPFMLPKTVFLLLLPVEMVRRWIRGADAVDRSDWDALLLLGGFIVIANCGSALFSFLGYAPWDVKQGRWSISEYALSALALPAVGAILCGWCAPWYEKKIPALRAPIAAVLAAAALVFGLNTVGNLAVYHRATWEIEQTYPALQLMSDYGGPGGSIVLDSGMWPSYRYIVERSGQQLPRGFAGMHIEVLDFSDLSMVAARGSTLPRPVHFIFATWDRQMKDRLQKALAAHGGVEATYVGKFLFTNLVTLASTSSTNR